MERGREMYSAALVKEDILAVRKIMKPRSSAIEKKLSKCNKLMLEYKRECETYQIYESIPNLIFSCMRLAAKIEEYMQKNPEFPGRDVVLDFYFELRNFLNIYERVDEHYVIYGQHDEEGRFVIKLFAWIRPLICRSVWIREMLRFSSRQRCCRFSIIRSF